MSFERHKAAPPMKAPGCAWEFWGGVIGISDKLCVFDAEWPVGYAGDFSKRARRALANHMIGLWERFRDEEPPKDEEQ